MEEISRCAGSAPLWIYGTVSVNTVYFLELLGSWERIEELGVRIYSDNKNIPDGVQRAFLSPAPALKLFDVNFTDVCHPRLLGDLRPGSLKSLFANHAPALRMIRSSPLSYTWNAPWLSNIRDIKFFPTNFTVEDIFLLLERTPAIETIKLASHFLSGSEEALLPCPSHKLNLPHLTSLKMKTNLAAAAAILDHIIPGSLWRLSININDPQTVQGQDPAIQSSFKHGLARHIASYFNTKPLKTVLLEINRNGLRFCDATKPIDEYDKPDFEVVTRQLEGRDDLFVCFLEAFTVALSDNLESKSTLETTMHIRLPRLKLEPYLIPKLYSFLVLFSHVCEIETDEEYMSTFFALSSRDHLSADDAGGDPQHAIFFPQLHTLRLVSRNSGINSILSDDLAQFLARRKTLGYPLTTLDFTRCERRYRAHSLCDLEDVVGLEVVWSEPKRKRVGKRKAGVDEDDEGQEVCRYVCGTGRPSVLRGLVKRRRLGV